MILAGPPKSSQQGSGVMGSEGDFLQSKGGSYIIGKKDAGAWEPGATIVRPDNTPETQVCYVSVGNDQVLRITYACRSLQGAQNETFRRQLAWLPGCCQLLG